MLIIVPSGSRYCFDAKCGIYFWGAHEHDGVWHLALIESAFHSWPFRFPSYAGQPLTGYNFLLDIWIYIWTLCGISSSLLYFKVQPIIWFGLFIFLIHKLTQQLDKDRLLFRYVLLFLLFGGSFGFIIQWTRNGTLFGSSGVPTMQGALGMTNPQFMWSLCVLCLIWICVASKKLQWILGPLICIGLGLKFYFIAPALVFVIWSLGENIVYRRYRAFFVLLVSCVLSIACAYILFYKGQGGGSGGLIWQPFALTHQMVEDRNMWFNEEMVRQRYFLLEAGSFMSPRLWWIEIQTIFYFIFFNYGIRIVGVIISPLAYLLFRSSRKTIVLLGTSIILSTLLPILYIQKGTWWNTIQFLYYGIFLAGILSAYISWLFVKKAPKFVQICIPFICMLTFLPSIYDLVHTFGNTRNVSYISDDEIEALQYLHTLPDGVVLTQPFVQGKHNKLPDRFDTAYVSALSRKQTYIADKDQMNLFNVPFENRLKQVKTAPCLHLDKVTYVYVRKDTKTESGFTCLDTIANASRIYENAGVELWSIR